MELPGYDAWKLASPYEGEPDYCTRCEQEIVEGECNCGDANDRADAYYEDWADYEEER